MDYARILQHIDDTDLTLREYRAARRLLDRASDQGTVYLDQQQTCDLFGTGTWGDARRILYALKTKGLITCTTNGAAYVRFLAEPAPARAETAQPRAEIAHQCADSARPDQPAADPARAESAQPRAEIAHQCADSARPAAPYKELNTAIRQAIQIHADCQPDSQPEEGLGETSRIDPAEQARSQALLTDPAIGCDPRLAAALAAAHPFGEIRRQIPRYLADLARGRVHSPAVLRRRLDGHFAAAITEQDRASPLWTRYAAPDELPPPEEPDPYADVTL